MGAGWPVLRGDAQGQADLLRRSREPKPCVTRGGVESVFVTGAWKPPWGHVCPQCPCLSAQGERQALLPRCFPEGNRGEACRAVSAMDGKVDKPARTPRRRRSSGRLVSSDPPRAARPAVAEGDRTVAAERDPGARGHTTSDHRTECASNSPRCTLRGRPRACAAPARQGSGSRRCSGLGRARRSQQTPPAVEWGAPRARGGGHWPL